VNTGYPSGSSWPLIRRTQPPPSPISRPLFPRSDGSQVEIEILDVRREPARAARDGIMVTPTLLKVSPLPTCRILGNLKNRDALLQLLGIEPPRPDPD